MNNQFQLGARRGLPICLGYLPVSFAYGMMAVSGGIGILHTLLISMTNLTSAGQFAGTNLMIAGAGWVEIALTTLVINLRYSVMALSLSQKLQGGVTWWQRMAIAFGITDETFALAMLHGEDVSMSFWMGLVSLPYIGWATGTLLGATAAAIMPAGVQQCLTIALYAMFIALVIPAGRKSRSIAVVAAVAAGLSTVVYYLPISAGFGTILVSVAAAAFGAALFPVPEGGDAL